MKLQEAIKNLTQKFTSGNDIPIRQATITREEWETIQPVLVQWNDFLDWSRRGWKEVWCEDKNKTTVEKHS